jgi:hypothetical protein
MISNTNIIVSESSTTNGITATPIVLDELPDDFGDDENDNDPSPGPNNIGSSLKGSKNRFPSFNGPDSHAVEDLNVDIDIDSDGRLVDDGGGLNPFSKHVMSENLNDRKENDSDPDATEPDKRVISRRKPSTIELNAASIGIKKSLDTSRAHDDDRNAGKGNTHLKTSQIEKKLNPLINPSSTKSKIQVPKLTYKRNDVEGIHVRISNSAN